MVSENLRVHAVLVLVLEQSGLDEAAAPRPRFGTIFYQQAQYKVPMIVSYHTSARVSLGLSCTMVRGACGSTDRGALDLDNLLTTCLLRR